MPLVTPFSLARFESVGAIGHSVSCDAFKHVLVELCAERRVVLCSKRNDRLKGFQCLDCSFETDGSRMDVARDCRLGHDRTDQIVGQDVCPDFFPNEFRCLAAQDVHLKDIFQRPQIKFRIPSSAVKICQFVFGVLVCVKERRHDRDRLTTKAWLFDLEPTFTNRQSFRPRYRIAELLRSPGCFVTYFL